MLRPIYLIGFMGSGKTTFGKSLAQQLDLPFIDLDERIETLVKKSIEHIFEQKGENHFRILEMEELHKTATQPAVIATGGGTPNYAQNMHWMRDNGTVIYLCMNAKTLNQRLKQSTSVRPVLQRYPTVAAAVADLLGQRTPVYLEATIIIDPLYVTPAILARHLSGSHQTGIST